MPAVPTKPPSVRHEVVEKHVPVIKDQARIMTSVSQEYLQSLGESMVAVGQLQEIGLYLQHVVENGKTIDQLTVCFGNCRVAAALLMPQMTHLRAVIFDQPLTESEFLLMRAIENFHRLDLTDFEKYRTCKELISVNPGWQGQDVAAALKYNPSMITRVVSLDRCCGAVKKAAETESLSASQWYPISKLSSEAAQLEMLAKWRAGATRDEMESAGRKARAKGNAPTVKMPSIKIALADDISVIVKGQGIDIERAIHATTEALKALKKAKAEGLDARTAVPYWKDRAKAGA